MICFRDKTFCPFTECAQFNNCSRAYTDKVKADAVKWWGSESAPVSLWSSKPGCFENYPAKAANGICPQGCKQAGIPCLDYEGENGTLICACTHHMDCHETVRVTL